MEDAPEGASTIPSATVSGGILFVPSSGITALKPSEGKLERIWRNEQTRPKTSSPVASEGRIYFPEGGVLTALRTDTGERLWKVRIPGGLQRLPSHRQRPPLSFQRGRNRSNRPSPAGNSKSRRSVVKSLWASWFFAPSDFRGGDLRRSDGHLWKLAKRKP